MKALTIAVIMALTLATTIQAASPNIINYQGRLRDTSGNLVADNTYAVTFTLYSVPSGGSPIWTEIQTVTTKGGLFTTVLGATTPFGPTAFSDSVRYLGIKVAADPEISPRSRLASVPYALANNSGWTDDGSVVRLITPTDSVGIGTVTPQLPLDVVGPLGSIWVARVGSPDTTGTVFQISNSSSASTWDYLVAGSNGADGYVDPGDQFIMCDGVSLPSIVLKKNGDVGIGPPHPKARLHVVGYDSTVGYFETSGTQNSSTGGGVVHAEFTGSLGGGQHATAVYGKAASNGIGTGGWFEGGATGVMGIVNQSGNGTYLGLSGLALNNGSGTAVGVAAAVSGSGTNYGVRATCTGGTLGYGVWGSASSGANHFAGYFSKGSPGVVPSAANPIAVFENNTNAYIEVNSTNSTERGILFGQPSNEVHGGILYNSAGIPYGLNFRTNGNVTRMVIGSNGNVGIGTTSPQARFEVKGGGYPTSFGLFDTDASGQDAGLRFYEAGTVKAHVYHQANTNTLNLYGAGFSGISVTSTGSVGIGTQTPSANLAVVGNICYTGSIGGCSDARYKKEVAILSGSLDKLKQLRGVSYRWKKDEYPDQHFDDREHIGFIAQEIEKLYPEVVMTDSAGYKSVDYGRLTPVLVEAVKEQQKTIESLTARLEALEATVNRLASAPHDGATFGQK
jgi:hypothetical protein